MTEEGMRVKANENRGESTPSRSAALKQKRLMSDNVHNNWTLGSSF